MLYGANGQAVSVGAPTTSVPPMPSESLERTVNAELARLDALLFIKWFPYAAWIESKQRWEGRYALCCRWPQIDGRWSLVQNGEMDPADAHDSMGWMCEDMEDSGSVPQDFGGISRLVLDRLSRCDNTVRNWPSRMRDVVEKNVKRHQAIKDDALNFTADEADYLYAKVKRNPIVAVTTNFKEQAS